MNCLKTFIDCPVGLCRILVGFVRVTPLRLWKAHSEMAVTSVPVSILKWVSVPSSFSETVQGEVFFPEFKTRRNAVSKLSSSALVATVLEKHWELHGGKDLLRVDSYRGVTQTSVVAKALEFLFLEWLQPASLRGSRSPLCKPISL